MMNRFLSKKISLMGGIVKTIFISNKLNVEEKGFFGVADLGFWICKKDPRGENNVHWEGAATVLVS